MQLAAMVIQPPELACLGGSLFSCHILRNITLLFFSHSMVSFARQRPAAQCPRRLWHVIIETLRMGIEFGRDFLDLVWCDSIGPPEVQILYYSTMLNHKSTTTLLFLLAGYSKCTQGPRRMLIFASWGLDDRYLRKILILTGKIPESQDSLAHLQDSTPISVKLQ